MPLGTNHSVEGASPASGLLVQTYESASPADVTQLFSASRTTESPLARAVPMVAQNWLRDPFSEKASVLRWEPPAIAVRVFLVAVCFDGRRRGQVHGDDHRRRAAGLRNALDHGGRGRGAKAHAAHLGAADEAQQAGLAERVDAGTRKASGAVDLGGPRLDDSPDDPLEHVEGLFCGHSFLLCVMAYSLCVVEPH